MISETRQGTTNSNSCRTPSTQHDDSLTIGGAVMCSSGRAVDQPTTSPVRSDCRYTRPRAQPAVTVLARCRYPLLPDYSLQITPILDTDLTEKIFMRSEIIKDTRVSKSFVFLDSKYCRSKPSSLEANKIQVT